MRNDSYDEDPNLDDLSLGELVSLDKTELESIMSSNGQRILELRELLTKLSTEGGEPDTPPAQ